MSKKQEEVLGELLRRGSARSRLLGLNNTKAEMREWIKTMSRKRLVQLLNYIIVIHILPNVITVFTWTRNHCFE